MDKKQSKSDIVKKISFLTIGAVGLALIITATVMFSNHYKEVLNSAQVEATNRTESAAIEVLDKVNNYETTIQTVAGSINEIKEETEFNNYISDIEKNNTFLYNDIHCYKVRYFKDGKFYTKDGDIVTLYADDLAVSYVNEESHPASLLGIQTLPMNEKDISNGTCLSVEFYTPLMSTFADGMCFYFNDLDFGKYIGNIFLKDSAIHSDAIYTSLINVDGQIYAGAENANSLNLVDELASLIGNTRVIDEFKAKLTNHESGTIMCKVGGVNHIISVKSDFDKLRNFTIVEFYNCEVLAKSANDFINAVVAIIVTFIFVIVISIGVLVFNHVRLQKIVNNSEKTDLKLGCLNRHGFEVEAEEILNREKELYYAVIVINLRHFKFLFENFGESETNSLLQYIKTTLQKTCKIEEIYGHFGHGEFLVLLHAKNRDDLIDRLKIHSFLAKQYKGSHKFDVAIKYGIYERQVGEHTSVNKMVEYAIEANNAIVKATVQNVDMVFNFYDDELRKIRLINDDMELRQDSALRDGEFQVFYQAKYNLKNHKQDGAEALVRWYDPKTGEYNKPALFMPLFESNGFIEKLDKYVYTKVCEYISYSIQQGRNVFPVSVNVSRITATQPDFVDYYAKTLKKYGISNGAITIEFTESFAYENYDVLKDIVDKLHKAGFKTSIDDFGCGYSSYRILKELPMDEIKLDKFFIDYSENPDRINSIFESVISLAKKLGMKVTQEGVETPEDVELLKKLGCDVIQGYIYSHPLSLTDYLHFVQNTKDHNL